MPTSGCWATRWRRLDPVRARDYVEEAWRIVDPVLKQGTPVFEYEPGSWGPKEADNVSAARRLAEPGRDAMTLPLGSTGLPDGP
jgi:hypothetical protein